MGKDIIKSKEKNKSVGITAATHQLLVKLSNRYGMTQGEFISLLLWNCDLYGLIDLEQGEPMARIDKLERQIISIKDTINSAMESQEEERKRNSKDLSLSLEKIFKSIDKLKNKRRWPF